MKNNKKFGFTSQGYIAPRAESIALSYQGLLCTSASNLESDIEDFETGGNPINWDLP